MSLSLSATTTLSLSLFLPLQLFYPLSLCHFSSSSPFFATAILSPPYGTTILSLFLSLQPYLPSLPLQLVYPLSLRHFSSSSPFFATVILSPSYATAILSLFFCHCNSSLLSLPLSYQLGNFFLKYPFYVRSSALFPTYFLPLVAFVTHVLKTCLLHKNLPPHLF